MLFDEHVFKNVFSRMFLKNIKMKYDEYLNMNLKS